MTFRLYIYYCALCGAWAALAGWALGRTSAISDPLVRAGVNGLCLGLFVSLGLSVVDALWSLSIRQVVSFSLRVLVAVLVGLIGGMIGGLAGQILFGWQPRPAFLMVGWTITGLLIGASVGVFEVLASYLRGVDAGGAWRKIVNGILGGAAGGLLGGLLSVLLRGAWSSYYHHQPIDDDKLWSPSATGFVALGLCIGLLIGLAQVILKEAWIKVETGRRAGREMILSKPEVTIGRAESCDLGLFGDASIERLHARIVREDRCFLIADAGTAGGTFLNGRRLSGPAPLRSGDAIRVGSTDLRFGERTKRTN